MTGSPFEFFQPGMAHWDAEKRRQRDEAHEYFTGAPPWDAVLDGGVMTIRPAPGPDLEGDSDPPISGVRDDS
ncbi:MAG: hypothetical protein LBD70_00725 [Bifidobacteriaceae bacterium]|jgi:hypothetical protein|nr:hypothetical protein [Bifidobacteriaceae bacterium]